MEKILTRSEVYKRDGLQSTKTQKLRNGYHYKPCPVCKRTMICGTFYSPTLDHIIPICLGGNHKEENWRIICRSCNSSRNFKREIKEWQNHE